MPPAPIWWDRPASGRLAQAAGVAQQPGEVVARQRRTAVTIAAGHVLVRDQGVHHGLLGGLHDGLEERVQFLPREELEPAQGLRAGPERARIGRRESKEQVTGEV